MTLQQAIAIASVLITLIVGFSGLILKLGKLELKIDLMWQWFMRQAIEGQPGGRRHTDPPVADDHA